MPAKRQNPIGGLHARRNLPLVLNPQHAFEIALPLQNTLPTINRAGPTITATLGLRSTLYTTPTNAAADPSLHIDYAYGPLTAAITAATRHQYVFQTGFSDMGLPSEFWILADARHSSQSARGISVDMSMFQE